MLPHLTRRVMLVDDDPDHLLLWRRVLELCGCEVYGFVDPLAALEALGEQPCDCVITDYQMPGITGAELIRRALAGARAAHDSASPSRSRHASPAGFIVLTGNNSPEIAREAMAA